MKYKILRKFKDKYTGEIYKINSVKEFSDERAKEILQVGKLISEVEIAQEVEKKQNKEKTKKSK